MDVKLPNLGEGADSGTVVRILIREGDRIEMDQPVIELENEKAVASIPSTAAGVVTKILVKEGAKISVGQRILTVGDSGAAVQEKPVPAKVEHEVESPSAPSKEHARPAEADAEEQPDESEAEPSGPEPAASPSLRKIARDLGIDLRRVRGSERGGRIVMADLRGYVERLTKLAARGQKGASVPEAAKPAPVSVDFSQWGPIVKKPLSQLRQVIGRRMTESWNTIPHVTQFDEADITGLLDLRKKYAAAYEQSGAKLTLTGFVLRVVADVLKKHPLFNASLDEATSEVVFKDYCHIGIAVDTEAGLMVPVIRDVDKKSVLELSKELENLAARTRARKISADEMKGGSFTLSNQGGIGGAHFTPIVNKPQVAILGLGKGAQKAVVKNGQIVPRVMMPMGLSYDHRLIDGGGAARFSVDLVAALEDFKEDAVRL